MAGNMTANSWPYSSNRTHIFSLTSVVGWSFVFFFYEIFYLFTFQYYPLSCLTVHKPPPPLPPASMKMVPHPPLIPTSLPWHSPTMGHQAFTGPRASPPIDAQQGHPLLLESWVPPCVLLVWWFSPWELGARRRGSGWLILLFFLWVCKPPSVLSLIPPLGTPLGTPCSVQWLGVIIGLCIYQALALFLRKWETAISGSC